MFNVSTEQIKETKRLQKESQSEVVLLKGIHACKTVFTYTYLHIKTLFMLMNVWKNNTKSKSTTWTNQIWSKIIIFLPKNVVILRLKIRLLATKVIVAHG